MDCFIQNAYLMNLSEPNISRTNILIEHGHVSAIGENLEVPSDTFVLNADGCYLTAGWIDAHAHLYTHPDTIGLDRDVFLSSGVTYMIDAGTAGPANFHDYLERDVRHKKMPGKAYLNLAYMGLLKSGGELTDLRNVDLTACKQVIHDYPEEIIGIKLRIDPRICESPERAMELASTLSLETGLPLIVHASRTKMPIEDILSFMKQGDIFAHSFADKLPGILDEHGNIKAAVLSARERGIFFDLSHGNGNFSFSVAKKAIAQGFLPNAISTDLHSGSFKKVDSLALTMSKMLSCGLDLTTVLRLVTTESAKMLQISEKATQVSIGMPADLTLFRLEEGNFQFEDSDGILNCGKLMIHPYCTLLNDKLYWAAPSA